MERSILKTRPGPKRTDEDRWQTMTPAALPAVYTTGARHVLAAEGRGIETGGKGTRDSHHGHCHVGEEQQD